MFELPPFRNCPKCGKLSFGTLSVGGTLATKRCKDCKYSHSDVLPDVDKSVVYLDQFAVSELYKTKTKTRRQGAPSEQFWQDCYSLANRAYLRQQVVPYFNRPMLLRKPGAVIEVVIGPAAPMGAEDGVRTLLDKHKIKARISRSKIPYRPV